LWHGLAASTRKTYSTGQRQFIIHAQLNGLYNPDGSILPASEPAILSWVAHLGGRVQPKTIKAYLSAMRSLHVDGGLPFTSVESPLVQRLVRGIKRYHGERDRKPVQPITLPILTTLLAQLKPGTIPGDTTTYAACCLAYSGLLRSGELTVGKGGKYSASLNLSRRSVQFLPTFADATHVRLTLPASKTDPFRKGVTITVAAAPGQLTCPVAALKALFIETPRPDDAPLFEQLDGQALSYSHFVKSIRNALSLAGLNPEIYAGHSFRRGAASAAAAAGYSDYEIQLLGRWRSDSYKLYIDNDPNRILHLSSLLHVAFTHLAPFEPPALRDFTAMA
ncbi:Integrase/recombinase xerD like protein, partial [Termitomyces sp. J132]